MNERNQATVLTKLNSICLQTLIFVTQYYCSRSPSHENIIDTDVLTSRVQPSS